MELRPGRWHPGRADQVTPMRFFHIVFLAAVLASHPAAPAPKAHPALTFIEHLALGAGTEIAVSQVAGGPRKYGAGLLGAGITAGFKEGADWQAGRDTKKKAIRHFLMIALGAGIAAAAWHK
jgi:hypothetical protein